MLSRRGVGIWADRGGGAAAGVSPPMARSKAVAALVVEDMAPPEMLPIQLVVMVVAAAAAAAAACLSEQPAEAAARVARCTAMVRRLGCMTDPLVGPYIHTQKASRTEFGRAVRKPWLLLM